jgi:S1-C subfamily serine protease
VNPNFAEFKFTAETIEKFLSEVLPEDYPEDIALLRTSTPLMSNAIEDINTVAEVAAKKLLVTQLHAAFGLKFLLE